MTCICCGNTMDDFFLKKGFQIMRCGHCRLMSVKNTPKDLVPFYSKGYFTGDVSLDGYMDYDQDKEVARQTYELYIARVENILKKKPLMLEVGCATGYFMDLAKKSGWEVEGIDISEFAVQKAKDKKLKATVAILENYESPKKFDAVIMQDLIEHVKDPVGTIKKAADLIECGGVLSLTTPDSGSLWARAWGKRWHAFVPPQHLFYFSKDNLLAILQKNNFKVVYLGHHGKRFTVPYIFRLLYSWTGLKSFSKMAEWLSRSIFKNFSLPINLGDTIFLIAQKI